MEAIELLLGAGGESQGNLLTYYKAKLTAGSESLAKCQLKITNLGQKVASTEADLRNLRKQLENKNSELDSKQVLAFLVVQICIFFFKF